MNFTALLPWWGWALGAFGFTGLIVAALVFPAVAAFLWERLSLAIGKAIRTPLGAALIFGAIGFGVGWVISGIRAEHQCNAVVAKLEKDSKDATVARDKEIREELRLKYEPEVDRLKDKAADDDRKVQAYEDKIAGLKDRARCELGPDALNLLLRPE